MSDDRNDDDVIPLDPARRRPNRERDRDDGELDWTGVVPVSTAAGTWGVRAGRLVRSRRRGFKYEWIDVAPVPEVRGRVVRRDGDEILSVAYLLAFDGIEELVSDDELCRGALGARLGHSPDRHVVDVIAAAVRASSAGVAQLEATPQWSDSTLVVPDPSYGPEGFGELGTDASILGDRIVLRDQWQGVTAAAVLNPRLALVLGAAIAGPYVSKLRVVDNPWLHLVGDSSIGKTTALLCAAAMFGDPSSTLVSANATSIGLGAYLGSLSILPAIVDELGASHLSPAALEALGYRLAGGASRLTATRDGYWKRSARWRSVVLSSGNRGLARATASPGLPARVVELEGSIFDDGRSAELVRELVLSSYGWPLLELQRAPDVAGVGRARLLARGALGAPPGVLGRVADHLALFVAGAWRLGAMVDGTTELADAALEAARGALDDAATRADEEGRTIGDRLLDAIAEALAATPGRFPPIARSDDWAELDGFLDGGGTLGLLPGAAKRIAQGVELDDPIPALRQLADRGILARGDGRNLATRRRIGASLARAYIFPNFREKCSDMFRPSSDPWNRGSGPLTWNVPTVPTVPTHSLDRYTRTRETAKFLDSSPAELRELAALVGGRQLARATELEARVDRLLARGVPVEIAELAVTQGEEAALAAWRDKDRSAETSNEFSPAPARALEPPAFLSQGSHDGSGEKTAPRESASRPVARGVLVLPAEACALDELAELSIRRSAELVYLTGPGAPRFDVELAGWNGKVAPDGRGWYGYPEGSRGLGVRVVAQERDPSPFRRLPVDELGEAFATFAEAHGCQWQGSGGGTFARLLRDVHYRRGPHLSELGPSIEPRLALTGSVEGHALAWDREIGRGRRRIHVLDRNGAFLATLRDIRWGIGEPAHIAGQPWPEFDPREKRPGYWCVLLDRQGGGQPWPEELPYLLTASGEREDHSPARWITTPTAVFAARDLGLSVRVVEAWAWNESIAYTRAVHSRLTAARARLVAAPVDVSSEHRARGAAYQAHKVTYSEGVNWWRAEFHRPNLQERSAFVEGPTTWRPNAQAQVSAIARTNLLRACQRAGVAPVAALRVDELAFVDDELDRTAEAFAAAHGLELGTGLGEWKVSGSAIVEIPPAYSPGVLRDAIREAIP